MKLDHIVIMLSDMENHFAFYEVLLPQLGFRKIREHVFVNDEGNHLDFKQAPDADYCYRRYAPGLNHIGFTAHSEAQLIEIKNIMANARFDVPEIQTFDEGRAIFFKDSDGMRIEVACYQS
ncbi:VOC family protein [Aliikangiella maris]|uniref:VOC family protein n=2 Tax=Aliikangiella maris TaxID=3162458 RepID=A0ABV2BV10_9GAMM